MPRLRQVPREDADPIALSMYDAVFGPDRDPIADPGTATGTPGNWWTVFALIPDCLAHAVQGFQFYRSRSVACRRACVNSTRASRGAASSCLPALQAPAQRASRKSRSPRSPLGGERSSIRERAVLAYTDDLVLQGGRVADGTFAALKAHLSDEEILELTYITCTYEMHATMCRALRLEYDDVDERIVEVPMPEDEARSIDFMAVVDPERGGTAPGT